VQAFFTFVISRGSLVIPDTLKEEVLNNFTMSWDI